MNTPTETKVYCGHCRTSIMIYGPCDIVRYLLDSGWHNSVTIRNEMHKVTLPNGKTGLVRVAEYKADLGAFCCREECAQAYYRNDISGESKYFLDASGGTGSEQLRKQFAKESRKYDDAQKHKVEPEQRFHCGNCGVESPPFPASFGSERAIEYLKACGWHYIAGQFGCTIDCAKTLVKPREQPTAVTELHPSYRQTAAPAPKNSARNRGRAST